MDYINKRYARCHWLGLNGGLLPDSCSKEARMIVWYNRQRQRIFIPGSFDPFSAYCFRSRRAEEEGATSIVLDGEKLKVKPSQEADGLSKMSRRGSPSTRFVACCERKTIDCFDMALDHSSTWPSPPPEMRGLCFTAAHLAPIASSLRSVLSQSNLVFVVWCASDLCSLYCTSTSYRAFRSMLVPYFHNYLQALSICSLSFLWATRHEAFSCYAYA